MNKTRNEPDKTNKITCASSEEPDYSEHPLARRNIGSLASHWAHSEDSDQTVQMRRLIWVFTGHTSFCHAVAQMVVNKNAKKDHKKLEWIELQI